MTAGWVVGTLIGGGDTQTLLALIEKIEHFAPTGDRGCKNISLMFESPGETLTIFKLLSLLLKRINYFFENAKTPSNSLSLGKMWISLRKIWNDFMQRETFLKIDMSVTCLVNLLKNFESRLELFDPSATGIQKQIRRLKCNQMLSLQALKIGKISCKIKNWKPIIL